MDDPNSALRHHQLELSIAEGLDAAGLQARACANLGVTQETLGQYEEAIRLQEQSLSLAAAAGDQPARAAAFASLGRLHHLCGDLPRALSYLQSGLSLSEGLGRREEAARLRHRLGLVHWEAGEGVNHVALRNYKRADVLSLFFSGARARASENPDGRTLARGNDALGALGYRVHFPNTRSCSGLTRGERMRRIQIMECASFG